MNDSGNESNRELAHYIETAHRGFAAFVQANNPEQQQEILDIMQKADEASADVIYEYADVPARQADRRLQSLGETMLSSIEAVISDTPEKLDSSSPESEENRKQRLIEGFENGISAFFPEGISLSEKARLFSLSVQADKEPSRVKEDNAAIFEARADLVEALIDKRYPDMNIYSGMCAADIFETADWLYGGDESVYADRQWSIDPTTLYKLNPNLLRHSKERVESASIGLSELLDAPIDKVIVAAYRGIYRYMQYPEIIKSEIQELINMGIDPKRIARRPDLTNFPLKVLLKRHDEYLQMGIPIELMQNNVQLYVHNPETIAKRVATLEEYIGKLNQVVLSNEEAEIMLAEYKSRKSLVIDFGINRIKPNLDLVLRYAGPADWIEALSSVQAEDLNSKIGSILYNVLKVKPEDLEAAMSDTPQGNIFNIAREIILSSRRNKRT